jgi:hypothetical protein
LCATAIERSSGFFPICQFPVPAESTVNLFGASLDANIPSANGERQILPRHTIKILVVIKKYFMQILGYKNKQLKIIMIISCEYLQQIS